jgi:hypothetical protein
MRAERAEEGNERMKGRGGRNQGGKRKISKALTFSAKQSNILKYHLYPILRYAFAYVVRHNGTLVCCMEIQFFRTTMYAKWVPSWDRGSNKYP